MIGYYINFWERPEKTIATFNGLLYYSTLGGTITLFDDRSSSEASRKVLAAVDGLAEVVRLEMRSGTGLARFKAVQAFLASDNEIGMFFDNDVEFSCGFDEEAVRIFNEHSGKHWPCLGSAYRSAADGHLANDTVMDGYVLGKTCGGLSMIMDRRTATHVLDIMPEPRWDTMWDWTIMGLIPACIKPIKSLVDHMPPDPMALNKLTVDRAYQFVG